MSSDFFVIHESGKEIFHVKNAVLISEMLHKKNKGLALT